MNCPENIIIKEGYLDKKSRHVGTWRKRWTVLSQEIIQNEYHYYLSTYKKEKVYKSPTERIRIDVRTQIEQYHKLFGPIFYIQNSEQIFIFKPSIYSLREEWMQILSHPMPSHDLFTTAIKKEGYLYIQNDYTNQLTKRWTVLYQQKSIDPNKYCYYMYTYEKEKNYRLHTSKILIDEKTQIKEINKNNGESRFSVENTKSKRKNIFQTTSKNERNEWVNSLFYDISTRNFNKIFIKEFIRQSAEKIPSEIQEIIYLFWGSYINHSIDQTIDARNSSGKWFSATILYHKSPSESIPENLKNQLTTTQEQNILRLSKVEAFYVIFHFDLNTTTKCINFNVGAKIDCKTWSRWDCATIIKHKKVGESVSMDVYDKLGTLKLTAGRESLTNMEAIFVSFNYRDSKWVFFDNSAICQCNDECDIEKHKLCRPDTQSQIEVWDDGYDRKQYMWGRWIFLEYDIVCNLFCRGRVCNNLQHHISGKAMDKQLIAKQKKKYNKQFVMTFIQQIQMELSIFIALTLKIKELIYLFWGEWMQYTEGSKVDVRNAKGMWSKGTINYYKPALCKIPSRLELYVTPIQRRYLVKLHNLEALYIRYHVVETDKQWLKFKVGQEIDCRDDGCNGSKWHLVTIKQHKKPYEPLPISVKLTKQQKKETDKILKLEAIFVHYIYIINEQSWGSWDEWIFIDKNTICTCDEKCSKYDEPKHRIAAPNTQTQINKTEWIFLETGNNNKICNAYCRGRLCENMNHKLSKATINKSASSDTNMNYNRLLVMNFIQTIEIKHNLFISLDLKEIIYMFWGSWVQCKVGNKINARNADGIWFRATINYYKPQSQPIPPTLEPQLSSEQWENSDSLSEFEAIFVHFQLDKKENNNWRNFKIEDSVDFRDVDWHLSEIIKYKKPSETIESNVNLRDKTEEQIQKLQKLEALLVRYKPGRSSFDVVKWLFIEEDIICKCDTECNDEQHQICSPNTQSRIGCYKTSVGFHEILNPEYGKRVWGEWIFLQNDTICNCYCNGTLCTNFNHRVTKRN